MKNVSYPVNQVTLPSSPTYQHSPLGSNPQEIETESDPSFEIKIHRNAAEAAALKNFLNELIEYDKQYSFGRDATGWDTASKFATFARDAARITRSGIAVSSNFYFLSSCVQDGSLCSAMLTSYPHISPWLIVMTVIDHSLTCFKPFLSILEKYYKDPTTETQQSREFLKILYDSFFTSKEVRAALLFFAVCCINAPLFLGEKIKSIHASNLNLACFVAGFLGNSIFAIVYDGFSMCKNVRQAYDWCQCFRIISKMNYPEDLLNPEDKEGLNELKEKLEKFTINNSPILGAIGDLFLLLCDFVAMVRYASLIALLLFNLSNISVAAISWIQSFYCGCMFFLGVGALFSLALPSIKILRFSCAKMQEGCLNIYSNYSNIA